MHFARSFALPVLAVAATIACASTGLVETATTAQLDSAFTLYVRQEATIEGTGLRIRFDSVPSDSRCPIDVMCVWAGDAVVRLLVTQPGSAQNTLDLHTTLEPRAGTVAGYRIMLEGLQPARRSDRPISADQYTAGLRVVRDQ